MDDLDNPTRRPTGPSGEPNLAHLPLVPVERPGPRHEPTVRGSMPCSRVLEALASCPAPGAAALAAEPCARSPSARHPSSAHLDPAQHRARATRASVEALSSSLCVAHCGAASRPRSRPAACATTNTLPPLLALVADSLPLAHSRLHARHAHHVLLLRCAPPFPRSVLLSSCSSCPPPRSTGAPAAKPASTGFSASCAPQPLPRHVP